MRAVARTTAAHAPLTATMYLSSRLSTEAVACRASCMRSPVTALVTSPSSACLGRCSCADARLARMIVPISSSGSLACTWLWGGRVASPPCVVRPRARFSRTGMSVGSPKSLLLWHGNTGYTRSTSISACQLTAVQCLGGDAARLTRLWLRASTAGLVFVLASEAWWQVGPARSVCKYKRCG